MFRSRLSRFFFASVAALGLTSFCSARNTKPWPIVPLSKQQFEKLPPSYKQHYWLSQDRKWAVDDVYAELDSSPANSFDPSGSLVPLRVWNLSTGRSFKLKLPWGYEDGLGDIAVAPNGFMAVVVGYGHEYDTTMARPEDILIYNLRTRRYYHLPISKIGDYEPVQQMRFVHDGSQLYIATGRTVYLFDIPKKRLIKRFHLGDKWRPKNNYVKEIDGMEDEDAASLTPDARFYTQFHPDTLIMSLWDVKREHLIHRFRVDKKPKSVKSFAYSYSPDGHVLSYSLEGKEYRFIDVFSGRLLWRVPTRNFNLSKERYFFSPDGRECFLVLEKNIEVRDTHTGYLLRSLPKLQERIENKYWLSADGSTLMSSNEVAIWKQRAR